LVFLFETTVILPADGHTVIQPPELNMLRYYPDIGFPRGEDFLMPQSVPMKRKIKKNQEKANRFELSQFCFPY